MTYALITSKMATLIAIMTKKNFPMAPPLADPNAKQQEWFSADRRRQPEFAVA
jgi:hypothetical protein